MIGAAFLIGTRPLSDNSFLTHLSTGRLILDQGHIPRFDTYSFTAEGTPWVVQSWLASVLYAVVERIGGGLGLQVLYGLLCAALGYLLWRLSSGADGLVVRLGLVALALAVGAEQWAERPFMFGVVFFGVYLVACERELPGPALALVGWLWVNTHGSFPLGLVAIVALAAGRRLDGEDARLELKTLRWAAAGMALGALNPLGPKLLFFPVRLLQRQEILREVIEWQAPSFQSLGDRAFLLLMLVAIGAIGRRPSWRATVPTLIFVAAALVGSRNLVLASMVLVLVTARAMRGVGSIRVDAPVPGGPVLSGAACIVIALIAASRYSGDHFALEARYPTAAIAHLDSAGVEFGERHLVSMDYVGNLMTLLYPGDRTVYFDDRYDMYPVDQSEGYLRLLRGQSGWRAQLQRAEADLVIWDRQLPLAGLLGLDAGWRTVLTEERWVTFCRRGSGLTTLGC